MLLNLRHSLRRLRRTPGHTALIVFCLALGIGANTAIFSVVNTLLLRPMPIPGIGQVDVTVEMREGVDPYPGSMAAFIAYREQAESFRHGSNEGNRQGSNEGYRQPSKQRTDVQVAALEMLMDLDTANVRHLGGATPADLAVGSDAVGDLEEFGLLPDVDRPPGPQIWEVDLAAMSQGRYHGTFSFAVPRREPVLSPTEASEEVREIGERLRRTYSIYRAVKANQEPAEDFRHVDVAALDDFFLDAFDVPRGIQVWDVVSEGRSKGKFSYGVQASEDVQKISKRPNAVISKCQTFMAYQERAERFRHDEQQEADVRVGVLEMMDVDPNLGFTADDRQVGVATPTDFTLTGGFEPEHVAGSRVSYGFLPTLGVEPILGRGFALEEDLFGGPDVVLLGHALWQRRFGGDPGVVESTVLLDNRAFTVLGVMPPGFDVPQGAQVWVPHQTDLGSMSEGRYNGKFRYVVSRRKAGVSLAQASEEVRQISERLNEAYPKYRTGWSLRLVPLRNDLLGDPDREIAKGLYLLLALVGFLLLLACANVASLLLVRALGRCHEIAVRRALGATRRGLFAQLMTESLLLALFGAAAGLLLAVLVLPRLMALLPDTSHAYGGFFDGASVDGRVLGFTVVVSLFTGVLFGLMPARRVAFARNMTPLLGVGGRRSGNSRRGRRTLTALVVGEVAVAVVLLAAAIVAVRSFRSYLTMELGYETDDRLLVELHLSKADFPSHAQRATFVDQVLERVRGLPGVLSAGTTTDLPVGKVTWNETVLAEGQPEVNLSEALFTAHRIVSAGYLEALGVRLLEGRLLSPQDTADSQPVVVVSRHLAEAIWPGESPIGKRVRSYPSRPWMTVVGMVDGVKEDRPNFRIDRPAWYVPYTQHPTDHRIWLTIHTDGDPNRLAGPAREVVRSVHAGQPISGVTTFEAHLDEFFGPQRFAAVLAGLFAVLGLVLAAIGIYGVMTHAVAQRSREISVRAALGATPGQLRRELVGQGMRSAAKGLLLGTAGSLMVGHLVSGLVYEARPEQPAVLFGIAMAIFAVTLIATYPAASRATRARLMAALREE